MIVMLIFHKGLNAVGIHRIYRRKHPGRETSRVKEYERHVFDM